jgi:hypothetical protein
MAVVGGPGVETLKRGEADDHQILTLAFRPPVSRLQPPPARRITCANPLFGTRRDLR